MPPDALAASSALVTTPHPADCPGGCDGSATVREPGSRCLVGCPEGVPAPTRPRGHVAFLGNTIAPPDAGRRLVAEALATLDHRRRLAELHAQDEADESAAYRASVGAR